MAEESTFRGIILFFEKLGIYDVILPFLLVFTIVFAILEKTKVLGMDEIEGKKYTKKNLNAIVSFVIGFLIILSSNLVKIVNQTASHIVILLFLSIFFLLLVGSFMKEGEGVALEGGWKMTFMIIMFIGIVIIFLNALSTEGGETWLDWLIRQLTQNFSSNAVGSIVLIIIVILFMMFAVRDNKPRSESKSSKDK
ncbi:MAG: hypothetical protein V1740_04260 [Candidatus Woesearchaeota archaeon]